MGYSLCIPRSTAFIAIISDGTTEWHVAATALLSGDTLTLQGFHIHDRSEDLLALARDLAGMSVQLRRRVPAVGTVLVVAELRTRRGLSRREYAGLLGLDVRTLQNLEQNRNRPDSAAISLVRVFDRTPDTVEEALTEPVA